MTKIIAYIGLGSNLGRRMANLEEAVDRLHHREGVHVTRLSPVYETAPVGYVNQPDFLNACAEIKTTLSPMDLLHTLLDVERELHRVRVMRWGPRTIDLDLLLYGDQIIQTEDLTVPHPRMTERPFVLIPLADLIPERIIPGTGKTVIHWVRETGQPEDLVRSSDTFCSYTVAKKESLPSGSKEVSDG
ncbi:2-amino-4-hydroxy-6-hydroxymethyldihydropteridine diphosphokinase [Melghirimyces algeriensis]|uniref:2-amino-4-hydroxy-6-hydroxymethyldihydropteridine diphosphokinase n=1 Tax=Melghirimyces algeriensis TaxID=910412 RepID=A0A521E9I9_9BACL|nr:2-amino-4-hydroxy-6-hydroxymethyldihydropteridine diphosphokinase [Melghirimyces algeriensis]SMO80607.1 2-amino-4-hydroxy-6-hydroxymethyldihydropteridinediphosphokinase [Melghirimyces algeriensis]